jgi:hypothetical protein
MVSHDLTATLLLLATTLVSATAGAQAPLLEESEGQTAVSNEYYRVTISHERGGAISSIALNNGAVIVGEHALYTDSGIYADRLTVTSANETKPAVEVAREGPQVVVTSRGVLRGTGDLASPPRRLDYVITYRLDRSPAIRTTWSATPSFSLAAPSGFFSYVMHVPSYAEWFAKTAKGVVFQPARGMNGRCFQSAIEPLDFEDPWMGVSLDDGSIVALSDIRGEPQFGNVFMHESETKTTAIFCAWFSGPAVADFVAGSPWSGGFTLHVWPRKHQKTVALPAFLG